MNNTIDQRDICEYAFCQGGVNAHKDSINKRSLLVFTALGAMTLQFRRGPARLLSVDQVKAFQLDLCDTGIRSIEDSGIASSETKAMATLAAGLFRDNFETKAAHVYFDRRNPAVPDFWQCKRLWREHQIEFLAYVSLVQRQVLAGSAQRHLQLVR